MYDKLNILWHCLFWRLEWKLTLFLSCGHRWVFQICWHIECSTLTATSFRILNSSAGIPSPPLALFKVMLFKAHLTSHSRMSGSGWVTTSWWLSVSLRLFCFFVQFFYVSCHIFWISSASVRVLWFLSFSVPIFAWNVPLVFPIFLKRSLVFPILLFSCSSLHCSLKKAFLSLLALFGTLLYSDRYIFPFLLCHLLLFFSQLLVRPPKKTTLPSCISFSWGWFLLTFSC